MVFYGIKYMEGVSKASRNEHSHETLRGVTVYNTGSPSRWTQYRFLGFKMLMNVHLWVELF